MTRAALALAVVAAALAGAAAGVVAAVLLSGGEAGAASAVPQAREVPAAAGTTADRAGVAAVARMALPGVVGIRVDGAGPRGGGGAQGSGFAVDDEGRILTNAHVVAGAAEVRVVLHDGAVARARVLGVDESSDLALLEADLADGRLRPLELADPASVEVGETAVAIGSPLGYDGSVSAGVVSAKGRTISAPNGYAIGDAIQTDAPINHGSSGGPLLDLDGRVIGVNAQIADSGVDGNVGIGFAIPSDTAAEVAGRLARDGDIGHAWLGVAGIDATEARADGAPAPAARGVLVTGVAPGSPAARAGLAAGDRAVRGPGGVYCAGGDVITRAGGRDLDGLTDLLEAVADAGPGGRIELEVVRGGGRVTLEVTLVERPQAPPAPERACA